VKTLGDKRLGTVLIALTGGSARRSCGVVVPVALRLLLSLGAGFAAFPMLARHAFGCDLTLAGHNAHPELLAKRLLTSPVSGTPDRDWSDSVIIMSCVRIHVTFQEPFGSLSISAH
jgi:hypothetical protein